MDLALAHPETIGYPTIKEGFSLGINTVSFGLKNIFYFVA
ncbi:hypothetical protein COLO4_19512 [Corchorus olitorius]|uniref:Uncharacterized protein n=1 Tax=Corchorus olitorius TaxID=93759 RepID=A0A1R3J524_9ROSI|nr:hypothetical protein COLO4_19512 [Corchorus olitorius]